MKTRIFALLLAPWALTLFAAAPARAGSATWLSIPGNGDWDTTANWMVTSGMGYPNGISDVATFDTSSTTSITFSALSTSVAQIVFNSGASAYTITSTPGTGLSITGTGITNNSGFIQNFVTGSTASQGGSIQFYNTATAGSNTAFTNTVSGNSGVTSFHNTATADHAAFTNNGATASGTGATTFFLDSSTAASGTFTNSGGTVSGAGGGSTQFFTSATAGSGTFTNNPSTGGGSGGFTQFSGSSSSVFSNAGTGTFINNAGGSGTSGGLTQFFNFSSAANGTFTNNGTLASGVTGGVTRFNDSSTAGSATLTCNAGAVTGAGGGETNFLTSSTAANATLIANGGTGLGGSIAFFSTSTGGTARVELFANGNLNIGGHNSPGVTIGSIEGSGSVILGFNNLTVGSNNLSKTFSGVIQDSGNPGGSLTKTGTGALTLSGANTYIGGTTVNGGSLLVNNTTGSGTGTGSVSVTNGGTILGGNGRISGPVTVNSGAVLLGGKGTPTGTLTLANNLTPNASSIIELVLGAAGSHSTLTRTGGTWTLPANQAFTFINGGAQPGVYDNIITGLAADPGTEGTWTITNPGFTGTFSYDGAGNIDLTLTAVHPQIAGAVSSKMHGAGTFTVTLGLNGTLGIECRSGGVTGDYQMVISFSHNVSVSGNPQAAVTSGQGVVGTGGMANGGMVSVSGSDVTVPLTNVGNAQTIVVTLFGVNDGTNSGDVSVPMGVLLSDVNANGILTNADVSLVKAQVAAGGTVDATNFRDDVNANGVITNADVSITKAQVAAGAQLP